MGKFASCRADLNPDARSTGQMSEKFRIIPFVASLLICSLGCNLSAATPQVRLSVEVKGANGDDTRMVSALSHELRKLDGVSVTDIQPALEITCALMKITGGSGATPLGYACSVAVTNHDNRLISHLVKTAPTIETLAHEIAISLDGEIIEALRRAPQPSSSP